MMVGSGKLKLREFTARESQLDRSRQVKCVLLLLTWVNLLTIG